jgi:hypothetical protein
MCICPQQGVVATVIRPVRELIQPPRDDSSRNWTVPRPSINRRGVRDRGSRFALIEAAGDLREVPSQATGSGGRFGDESVVVADRSRQYHGVHGRPAFMGQGPERQEGQLRATTRME